ncbi:MAG: IPT/TIG domain-containing protein [Patescibacteria group bacterium]
MKFRIIIAALAVITSLVMGGDFISAVNAQVIDPGLNAVNENIGLSAADPRVIAARIINIALGFLGAVMLILILYAGFLWMTAGGDGAQVDKAKKYLRNAIIGVAIILLSWAIASFVINALLNATGGAGGGGGGGAGGGGGPGGGFGGGAADVFRIVSKSPAGQVDNADLIVRILFNREVDNNSLSELLLSPGVGGSWEIDSGNPKRVIFTPTDPCPGAPQKGCFAFDTQYSVTVGSDFRSASNEQIRCGGFYPDCTFTFTSGNTVDNQAPDVTIKNLYDGKSVPVDSAVEVIAGAVDDIGISGMEFSEAGQIFHSDGPNQSPTPKTFETTGYWDTVGKVAKQSYAVTVRAADLDSNVGTDNVNVIVLNQHCFNVVQDQDETGIDCGGVDCLSCNGSACTNNADCSSGLCVNGICVEQPIITDVKPSSGAVGTYVSIWGDNFGDTGTVTFLGPPEITAGAPQACITAGAQTWSDHFVLVEVPQGAATGSIRLLNGNSNLADRTDDDRGPQFTFNLTNEQKPGLCAADPTSGQPGDAVDLIGGNLGSAGGQVLFGNTLYNANTWNDALVGFIAPIVNPGAYGVAIVHQNGLESNKVPFKVQTPASAQAAPEITFIDPNTAPRGQYITIAGQRFGTAPGIVKFYDKAADKTYNGDAAFPNECAGGWWKDNNIVIKVPTVDANVVKPASFSVYIVRNDQKESNRVDFTYSDGTPGPGICAINPTSGPAGSLVSLKGERFGNSGANNQVVFATGQTASVQSWQSNQIDVTVPGQAITGAVFASVGGIDSNQVQFAVADCNNTPNICAAGQICCADGTCSDTVCAQKSFTAGYAWQISTGVVPKSPNIVEFCDASGQSQQNPSPTPWLNHKGGDQVCINPPPKIGVLFDMDIDWPPAQAPKQLFSLKKCVGAGFDPCEDLEEVNITTPSMSISGVPYVTFEPTSPLDPDALYYVLVSKNVRSADLTYGTVMDEKTSCPEPDLGYCYQFRTRNDTGDCEVGAVYVNPWKATVEGGEEQEFEALPATKGAECNLMKCDSFDFDWTTDPASKASIDGTQNPANSCHQVVIAGSQEAMTDPVKVRAEEILSAESGLADLYIRFITPKVMDRFSECDTTCSNSYLWAQFNTSLWSDTAPSVANSVIVKDPLKPGNYYRNVKLFRCKNENCYVEEQTEVPVKVTLDPVSFLEQYKNKPYSFVKIEPVQDMAAGAYYQVWLNGGEPDALMSRYGVILPKPEVWQFRVRLTNEACKPDAVIVRPAQKIEEQIGDRELFGASIVNKEDKCHAEGQTLKVLQSFNWSFADPAQQVAKFVFSGIDTGGILPKGCANNCTLEGSQGIFGKIATCGNGIVETTDDNFCQAGKTLAGQPCIILPNESGAGEQCDGGGLCDNQNCLFNPVSTLTCGDGVVQYQSGEMCDPGVRCWDATTTQSVIGMPCNSAQAIDTCTAAGGTCAMREYRGCSTGCRNLGSSSVATSVCGNGGAPGAGEDCDQGALNGIGGCTKNCLHRGSTSQVSSICGNGTKEPGESCEAPGAGQPVPSYCDDKKCINLGLSACAQKTDPNCCGNGKVEAGEDCDFGDNAKGDGCSADCLYEGSSYKYKQPSFCGNGVLETGEACESSQLGDGKIDPIQLAEIEPGLGTPNADDIISTDIKCGYENINGTALYGVQCGKTLESECNAPNGLGDNGCCSPRPELTYTYPAADNQGQGWCRNIQIEARFARRMDVNSVTNNFVLAKEYINVNDCPDGYEPLAVAEPKTPQGFWGWLANAWHGLVAWITGSPAKAVYCIQSVSGTLQPKGTSTTDFVYRLNEVLEPNTKYIVRFKGDPDAGSANDAGVKQGIKTLQGVVAFADTGENLQALGDYSWWFETGSDICRINNINVVDTNPDHPGYYQKPNEEHLFNALAQSIQNGVPQNLSQSNVYSWQWLPWIVSDPVLAAANDDPASQTQSVSQSAIRVSDKNGSAMVFATVLINKDELSTNFSTAGTTVEGATPIVVFLCEKPWPPLDQDDNFTPFKDAAEEAYQNVKISSLPQSLQTIINTLKSQNAPYFNFQTMYCRDHENGYLPSLNAYLIPQSASDKEMGIMRQYLFTFDIPAYQSDGIGIRIYKNTYGLSPAEWYRSRGFSGSYETLQIDGYEAIRDGGTAYIAFPNTEGLKQNIYNNIMVISHNVDASPITQQIYQYLLDNLIFNINFDFDNTNVCVKGGQTGVSGGMPYINQAIGINGPVTCTSDYECLKINNSPDDKLRCASFKYKLRHDMQRLLDFKNITQALDVYKAANGQYPALSSGTFQSGRTNSRWPSWQEALGSMLGITLPVDPVNRFVSCGLCKPDDNPGANSAIPCSTDEDCPSDAWFCEAQNGFDSRTCWNPDERKFFCPYMDEQGGQPNQTYDPFSDQEPYAPSRLYRYRAFDGGARFELGANFEVPPMSFAVDPNTGKATETINWWYPPVQVELRKCYTNSVISNGRWCTSIEDCKPCYDPFDPACTEPAPANSCRPVGFRWLYKNICNNDIQGDSTICGDKIIGLVCSAGANAGNPCTADGDCPGGTCSASELCELGQTQIETCDYSAPGAKDGFKTTVCEDCKRFVDDPNLSQCFPKKQCGNGRVDGYCNNDPTGAACGSNADCSGGQQCVLQEVCDDGVLNGTYGYCNADCSGYDKFCGNDKSDPGEQCDAGTENGAWCANPVACYGTTPLKDTCGLGCKGNAPYCGDGKTKYPEEECDGSILETADAICTAGANILQPCKTDEDCGDVKLNAKLPPGADKAVACGPNGVKNVKIGGIINPLATLKAKLNWQSCEGIKESRCATAAQICMTPQMVNDLKGISFFNKYDYSAYKPCRSNDGCNTAAGETCQPLNQGINCNVSLNDASGYNPQCSTASSPAAVGEVGVCREYDTVHIRRCNEPDPNSQNQCKYESKWSTCQIAHSCGDGIVDPGEECDNGNQNANHKACLPTCKVNVCGDGYTELNVEECDFGKYNGLTQCPVTGDPVEDALCKSVICDPKYGTTCNNCSQQCKLNAKAGGYCGNSIPETGEQCDGNVSIDSVSYSPKTDYILPEDLLSDVVVQQSRDYVGAVCANPPCQIMKTAGGAQTQITCEQLGYDFALNDIFNQAIRVTDWSKAGRNVYVPNKFSKAINFWYEPPEGLAGYLPLIYDPAKNGLLNKIYWDCGLTKADDLLKFTWLPQNEWPTKQQFWRCVDNLGAFRGFEMVGMQNNKPSCSASCQPAGCGRCSDEPGKGEIYGYVIDRIWLQAVPGARVSLQYRGQTIAQDTTKENGEFRFENLNDREECGHYRLVIDKYDNNVCTELAADRPQNGCLPDITAKFDRKIDEGANGGYWSHTTEEFSVASFPAQEMLGLIFIYPRPAKGEGYVSYGRPTLIDEEGWQRIKDCKEDPSLPECQEKLAFSFPWQPKWAPHIIWPANQARLSPVIKSKKYLLQGAESYMDDYYWDLCNYAKRGTDEAHPEDWGRTMACMTDYNWLNQGNLNLGSPPYTAMICPALKWDRSVFDNCPIAGVDVCVGNCVDGNAGAWKLIKSWTGISPNIATCEALCNPTGQCPTEQAILSGYGSNPPADPLMDIQKCHLNINNAQASGLFRYADPNNLSQPLPDLNEPIQIYFAAPDYEPMRRESLWTATVKDIDLSKWLNNQAYPPDYVNVLKSMQCGALTGMPKIKCEDQVQKGVDAAVSAGNIAPLSWREYWGKTNTPVIIATDKGIYTIKSNDSKSIRDDFRRPFWHMASIAPNGTVTVVNKWKNIYDLNVNNGQPNTDDTVKNSATAMRPPGMACWNDFGAACRMDAIRSPFEYRCDETTNDLGILYYPLDSQNTTLQFWQAVWTAYFASPNYNPLSYKAICHQSTETLKHNQINW